jgi:hypothetical protein
VQPAILRWTFLEIIFPILVLGSGGGSVLAAGLSQTANRELYNCAVEVGNKVGDPDLGKEIIVDIRHGTVLLNQKQRKALTRCLARYGWSKLGPPTWKEGVVRPPH